MRIDNTIQTELKANDLDVSKERKTTIDNGEKAMDTNTEKKSFTAVSRDGDTLELASKMNDAALAKCSKSKLKQLLSNGQITKQQYEKAIKKHQ